LECFSNFIGYSRICFPKLSGLAYGVKMNCRNIKLTSKKKFTENYPGYKLEIISYESGTDYKWILKL